MRTTIDFTFPELKEILRKGLEEGFKPQPNRLSGVVCEVSVPPEFFTAVKAGEFDEIIHLFRKKYGSAALANKTPH